MATIAPGDYRSFLSGADSGARLLKHLSYEGPGGGVMEQDSEIVELYEEMLTERAAKGVRPVLYISSCKDLECSLLVLLGETDGARFVVASPMPFKRSGYHFLKD